MSEETGGEVDDTPGSLPLERIPGYLIRRAQQVHNALWSAHVPDEVTGPQYAVLATLAVRPATQQGRLGELTSIDKSSVAEVVGRLVARNWVSKVRDPLDGRSSLLNLVEEATVSLGRLTPSARAVQEQFLAPLPADERARFIGWLRRISRFAPDADDGSLESAAPVLDLNVPGHLIRCAQQIHTAIWVRTFGDELTGPQYAILHILATRPDISQRELGELAALDRSEGMVAQQP
jgi:DNA-binding MarR family transcriptional regulator